MSGYEKLMPEFLAFETLPIHSEQDPSPRKASVRALETRVPELALSLSRQDLVDCAASPYALARILRYLLLMHEAGTAEPTAFRRVVDAELEALRRKAPGADVSTMPLYYAVKAYVEWRKEGSAAVQSGSAADAALFDQIGAALAERPELDAGGHIRGKLDEVRHLLDKSADAPSEGERVARITQAGTRAVAQITGKFGLVNASIAAAAVIAGALIAGAFALKARSDREQAASAPAGAASAPARRPEGPASAPQASRDRPAAGPS